MAGKRTSWLDDAQQTPMIDQSAHKLESFVAAMADGRIDTHELKEQEERVAKLMRQIEPMLDDATHEQVTALLCEITAYNVMAVLHEMRMARPKSAFRG